MTAPQNPDLSYEEAFRRLEEAVSLLSAGGLSLEDALARFEQGMTLANYCGTLLDQAELRVQQVGQLTPEALAAPGGSESRPSAVAGAPPAPAASAEGADGPFGGSASGARRGLPPSTGPQHKPVAGEPLDPLFDDI